MFSYVKCDTQSWWLEKMSIRSHYAPAIVLLDVNIQRRSHNQHLAACECVESSLLYIINYV